MQVPTQVPIPTKPTDTQVKDDPDRGVKLIYPQSNSVITETRPTIIGRIKQTASLLLDNEFKKGNFVHYNTDQVDYGINFIPGKLSNTLVTLDGNIQSITHGFPQYPYIICPTNETVKPTKETCIQDNLSDLPPIIFFIKPQTNLTTGIHKVTVEIGTQKHEYTFTIDPNASIPKQNLPKQLTDQYFGQNVPFIKNIFATFIKTAYAGHDDPVRNELDAKLGDIVSSKAQFFNISDYCPLGYHYPQNWFPLPLPSSVNKTIYYELYLPMRPDELGMKPQRKVDIIFNGHVYDFKLTDFKNFYFDDEIKNEVHMSAKKSLYVPTAHLAFAQTGETLDTYVDQLEVLPVAFNYLEYLPYDYADQLYKENALLYRTVNSSGCDG